MAGLLDFLKKDKMSLEEIERLKKQAAADREQAILKPDSASITDLAYRPNLTPKQLKQLREHGIMPDVLTGQSRTFDNDYYNLEKKLPEDIEEKEERTRNFKKLKKLFSEE